MGHAHVVFGEQTKDRKLREALEHFLQMKRPGKHAQAGIAILRELVHGGTFDPPPPPAWGRPGEIKGAVLTAIKALENDGELPTRRRAQARAVKDRCWRGAIYPTVPSIERVLREIESE